MSAGPFRWTLLLALACSACGGDAPVPVLARKPETCPVPPEPCGGDITGRWKLVDRCARSPEVGEDESCKGSSATILALSGDGDLTFNSDGTVEMDALIDIALRSAYPVECAGSCTGLEASLREDAPRDEAFDEVYSIDCPKEQGQCACLFHYGKKEQVTGTYVVSGNQVTVTNSAVIGSSETYSFCVEGERASYWKDDDIIQLERP